MRRILLAIAALFMASPAMAQSQQQIDWCTGKNSTDDQVIAGCTALIDGGQLPDAYKIRADLYYAKGQNDLALADYNAYFASGKSDLETLFKRGNLLYDAGRYDQALADYSRYLSFEPRADMVLAYRGDTYWKLDRNAEAIADYRASLALSPGNQVASDGLARLGTSPAATALPSVAAPPATREVANQCVTMAPIAGSANGFWRVTNICGQAVSGYYCFENGTRMRCSDATANGFGPVENRSTADVSGPGEQTAGRPGEIVYRVSYCPYDTYIEGSCTLERLN